VILALLFLLGLVTAWCSQLGDTTQRMAIAELHRAMEQDPPNPNAEKAPLASAAVALQASVRMWNVTLYAGLGIVVLAGLGWSLTARRSRGEGTSRAGPGAVLEPDAK
jgi:hypothetical protein